MSFWVRLETLNFPRRCGDGAAAGRRRVHFLQPTLWAAPYYQRLLVRTNKDGHSLEYLSHLEPSARRLWIETQSVVVNRNAPAGHFRKTLFGRFVNFTGVATSVNVKGVHAGSPNGALGNARTATMSITKTEVSPIRRHGRRFRRL